MNETAALPPAPGLAAARPGDDPRIALILSLVARRHEALTRAERVLVVGCGSGEECDAIAHLLPGARVTGLDLANGFRRREDPRVTFLVSDAVALPLPSKSFDFVYSFHALEHVTGGAPHAVAEIARVMRPDGAFFVGVPNRSRLVAYVDSDSTWRQKIAWNAKDWKDRMRGRFRNEFGAHAGYTERELRELLERRFREVRSERRDYFAGKYARAAGLVRGLARAGIGEILFPCNYYTCRGVRSD
jgi:SAM-dependent methyltransferase